MSSKRENAERLVSALYSGVLRRQASKEEIDGFADAIMRGAEPHEIAEQFVASEEFKSGSGTKLFVPPGHYYSPVANFGDTIQHLDRQAKAPLPDGLPGIRLDRAEMIRMWNLLLPTMKDQPFRDQPHPALRYHFDNPSYSWGDGSILQAMIRHFKPRRLIEVGSGWSSACTLDTIERSLGGQCRVTFIEPYPELLHKLIGQPKCQIDVIAKQVQQVPLSLFNELASGDILFIDSTHVMKTGSDVCFELFEVLPRLRPGVVVHIHDMFWPFEYPQHWIVEENRSWNELYAVRAYLQENHSWRILMFNSYLGLLEPELIKSTYPAFMRNSGGALWLQRM